jgi:hypothetical protein
LDSETGVKWLQKRDGSWYSESMPVSLLQLAYHPRGHEQPTCLLLPLSRLGLSEATAQVLAHPNILKVRAAAAHTAALVRRVMRQQPAVRVC